MKKTYGILLIIIGTLSLFLLSFNASPILKESGKTNMSTSIGILLFFICAWPGFRLVLFKNRQINVMEIKDVSLVHVVYWFMTMLLLSMLDIGFSWINFLLAIACLFIVIFSIWIINKKNK